MTSDTATTGALKQDIRRKIVDIARRAGADASGLHDDDVIPQVSGLDSAGIMELLVWFETHCDLTIDPSDITVENLGTVDAMAAYAERHGQRG
jgi:acyl carrier protein